MISRIIAAVAALLLAAPGDAAIESADSRAIVITPLSLLRVDDLDFGSLVPSAVSGIVSIDANNGAQSAVGGVTAYGAGNSQRGYFLGAGTAGQLVVIVLGPAPLLSNGGGNTMPMLALTLDGSPLRAIPADRILHIYVGGILSVAANQAPGDYAGTFSMTVNYF